ncbi:FCD domain-containing protein [Hyphomicrobium sp.]|uniref:FadR/GntR family transcriptional regulator n=1 Tax=Hyphomicrobium sp. TaxID=82 RepID=UPI0025C0C431|nr:FCD domain-containing protein [Hyphomicrobium sp.]MCC7252678.1 FadR family transcriptional regulator [Hyphomicrobium sp.]
MSQATDMDAPPWVRDPSRHPLITPQAKEIATRIFARIASGAYPFGTRIPAERDLAIEFQDTRATIRQALEFLATYDAVSRRAGSGTFVSYRKAPPVAAQADGNGSASALTIHQLAETASPFAMNVAESILEPEMVRLATIYMSTRDLAELGLQLASLETIVTESDRFAALEDDFMMMIARGTHNSLIAAMYAILHEVRRQPQWAESRRQMLTPSKIRSSQMLLRSLYEGIQRRDVETAVELIKLHVASTHEDMIYES